MSLILPTKRETNYQQRLTDWLLYTLDAGGKSRRSPWNFRIHSAWLTDRHFLVCQINSNLIPQPFETILINWHSNLHHDYIPNNQPAKCRYWFICYNWFKKKVFFSIALSFWSFRVEICMSINFEMSQNLKLVEMKSKLKNK